MLAGLTVEYWFTWFPASVLATCGILTLVWKGIVAFGRMVDSSKRTEAMDARLIRIEHEFSPNSGTSMRDKVDALGVGQLLGAQTMAGHIESDRQAFARQDTVNNRLESVLDRLEDHMRNQ